MSSRPRTQYFVILWALMLFENGYFDANFTFSQTPCPSDPFGGMWSADLWNPKYVLHVYKVTVAIDMLAISYGLAPWPPQHRLLFSFGMGMGLLVPEVISLIWSC